MLVSHAAVQGVMRKELIMEKCKVDFSSLSWENQLPGARFKTYQDNGRKLRFIEFSKTFVEPDWCIKGHIGFVLEGEMEIDFNGDVVHFGPGDGIFIPVGEATKHMAKVLTDVVKLVLVEDV